MSNKKETLSSGLDILDVLTIILVTLKVLGISNISWLMALSPLWIPAVICLIIGIFVKMVEVVARINNNENNVKD